METQDFKDAVRQGRGFFPSAPLHTPEAVGDAAIAGANCLFNKYGQIRSWRAYSPFNSPGAKLLHVVGGFLSGNKAGNVWKQHGETTFFIGSGQTFFDDFFNPIGVSTSQLQVRIAGQTFQAGLPQPSAPGIEIARDSAGQPIGGQVQGAVSAKLTRMRTITGAESAASDTSPVVTPTNGRVRLRFSAALTTQGQDEWGVYLTRQGFGGEGPHFFFKQIKEVEIAPLAAGAVAAGPGNGSATTFGGTTAVAVNSRSVILVLAPAASTLPSYVSSSFAITPGESASIRVQKPVGVLNTHYMTVQVTFKAVHRLTPSPTNKGVAKIASVTGVWTAAPPLNPQLQGIRIIVQQDSTTTFKWKKETDPSFSSSIALSTSPTALGSTGLAISWTANSTSSEEVGNMFTIDPFSLIPPTGWGEPVKAIGNLNGVIGVGVYGRVIDATLSEFSDWATSEPTLMSALAVAWKDVHNATPIVTSNAAATTTPQTTHQVTVSPAPTATQLVTFYFSGDDNLQAFTPTSPLAAVVSTSQLSRFIDVDFADDDLNENFIAPKDIEGPPAGTHGFPLGPLTVVAGALGGTALAPSRPNQAEQYDLTEVTFLNPPEPIVRCEISPHDGSIYIWTRNSLQTVIYTGETVEPVAPRTIWSQTGIANPSGACLSTTGAYACAAKRGFVRYLGSREPDKSFADPVNDFVKDWDPREVALGYDGILDAVAYCRRRDILLYFESLGIWSPPLKLGIYDLPGDPDLQARIVSCATLDNRLHFAVQTGPDADEDYEIFVFDEGLGGEWFLRGVSRHGDAPGMTKTISDLRLVADFTSDQELEYTSFVGVGRRTDMLVQDNPLTPGYCVGVVGLPKYWTTRGRFRLEWTITAPTLAERWVAFTASPNLARHGIGVPPLTLVDYNTNSLFAWRVDSGGVLTWYSSGVGTAHASVQVGDVIRIEWDVTGAARGQLRRSGALVGSTFNLGVPGGGWPAWLGFKLGLSGGGTVSLGNLSFAPRGQFGRLKVWKNFAAERKKGKPVFDQAYAADGDKHYDWEQPNITETVTYNIEVGGNSFDQDVSVCYVDGYVVPGRNSLLNQ